MPMRLLFWGWQMYWHSNHDRWSSDPPLGLRKHSMQTHRCSSWENFLFLLLGRQLSFDLKNFSRSSPTIIFSKPSYFAFSAGSLSGDIGVFDCYEPVSAKAEGLAPGWCKMTATRHCLTMDWFLTSSLIWSSTGIPLSGAELRKQPPVHEARVFPQRQCRENRCPP